MDKITADNLVHAINRLDKGISYNYINPHNSGLIRIVNVDLPDGPIRIKRWNPESNDPKKNNEMAAKEESISREMLWTAANAFTKESPVNMDRIFAGSYNLRSVLEALIANTPEFYYCYPKRIITMANGNSQQKNGQKHLMWVPENPHELGKLVEIPTDIAISDLPIMSVQYDSIGIPDYVLDQFRGLSIEVVRRHTQIQIALYLIGLQLGYSTWIAQNDKGIKYQGYALSEHEGVLNSLSDKRMISAFDGAANAGALIDCIWFKNNHLMPAVMEVEHTTGVTSGLDRMQKFHDKIPAIMTRYVIVAPDEARDEVFRKGKSEMFSNLNPRYFSYSAVEELYGLCTKRHLRNIGEGFLDCYMEPING